MPTATAQPIQSLLHSIAAEAITTREEVTLVLHGVPFARVEYLPLDEAQTDVLRAATAKEPT